MSVQSLTIYCGAKSGNNPNFKKAAYQVGIDAARLNKTIVYGGGATGLMGAVADGVLSENGKVIGVMPRFLTEQEIAHSKVLDMRIVETMHERKMELEQLGDAIIMLPGGAGTLEEFFEVFTWGQIGLHQKPIGILNVDGYFDHLKALIINAIDAGFLEERYLNMLFFKDNLVDMLESFDSYEPVAVRNFHDLK